jgi:hypothetical protein
VTVTAVIAMALIGQCEAAGSEQSNGNEQAADEFHHGLLRGRRGRNGAAIDFGRRDRKNMRLNGRQTSAAPFQAALSDRALPKMRKFQRWKPASFFATAMFFSCT